MRDGGAPNRAKRARSKAPNRTLEVLDEPDLYAMVPLFEPRIGSFVRKGSHLEIQITTRKLRRRAISRKDLATTDACTGATHLVSTRGALRVVVDTSAMALERERDAQKELEVGAYTACPEASPHSAR